METQGWLTEYNQALARRQHSEAVIIALQATVRCAEGVHAALQNAGVVVGEADHGLNMEEWLGRAEAAVQTALDATGRVHVASGAVAAAAALARARGHHKIDAPKVEEDQAIVKREVLKKGFADVVSDYRSAVVRRAAATMEELRAFNRAAAEYDEMQNDEAFRRLMAAVESLEESAGRSAKTLACALILFAHAS